MTIIATSKFRPNAGKTSLVSQNIKNVVSQFEKMGMSKEYQPMVRKGDALVELHRPWMSIPA